MRPENKPLKGTCEASKKLNRIVAVEECDASDDDQGTEDGYIKSDPDNYRDRNRKFKIESWLVN